MAGEDFFHFEISSAASIVAVGAAIHKAAAGLHVNGARHVAFQFDLHALALLLGIGDGNGRKEGFRVGVQGVGVEVNPVPKIWTSPLPQIVYNSIKEGNHGTRKTNH